MLLMERKNKSEEFKYCFYLFIFINFRIEITHLATFSFGCQLNLKSQSGLESVRKVMLVRREGKATGFRVAET